MDYASQLDSDRPLSKLGANILHAYCDLIFSTISTAMAKKFVCNGRDVDGQQKPPFHCLISKAEDLI